VHADQEPLGARGPELHNIGPAWDANTGGGSRIGEILRRRETHFKSTRLLGASIALAWTPTRRG